MTETRQTHPSPETVARLRAREPGTLLLFAVADGVYGAFDGDAMEVNRLLGAASGTVFYAGPGDERWVTFPADHLEPLLAAVVAQGGRAAVCEPAKDAPRGVPVERLVVPSGATDVADRRKT